ncbi:hypothetical protein GTP81_03460 [Rugamonas sp. FT107W]|uniref:Lytic transglycosylase domain-containing protein n=1 Tax=Duganella vulcania TaxID=2692166 RepID=A0A845HEJ2_9BURK|nr:hypothetical protein [Duganella vulcania]MYN15803.1 hypothetical protein [Duganella vulcania]
MIHSLRPLVIASALLACAQAAASSGGPWDPYVSRSGPDIALNRYQSGELGVLLPSYDRMYLYTAWRTVQLGADGLKSVPNPQGGLLRAIGSRNGGWVDATEGKKVYGAWLAAVGAALKQAPAAPKADDSMANGYLNCPLGGYTFATSTLNDLARRPDATPARLNAWVATQRQVFKFCGDDVDAPRNRFDETKRVIPAPAELPATEALYWRQVQQYQLASAAFYGENYALSASLFAKIGATDKHPLRQWGEYLSLRSQARAATFVPGPNADQAAWQERLDAKRESPAAAAARLAAAQKKLAAIQASADHILANPELASLHEATRAIVRSMQVRLTPTLRFAELSKLLDDPRANPYQDDHLGDWRVLANDLLQPPGADQTDARPALRASAGFIDWLQTLQQCEEYNAKRSCAVERAHAIDLWNRYAKEGNKAQARVWLLAAVMLSEKLTPELEKAAQQVASGTPEYLTMRHALARHYRLSNLADKARTIGDAVLTGPALAASNSSSARNQFLQERFAVASSPADAANYLLRTASRDLDPDTGEQAKASEDGGADKVRVDIAADGTRWLNSGLSVADLSALAASTNLSKPIRTQIAVAAWMRSDLLGQDDAALNAARQIEQTAPALAPVMEKYRKLAGTPEHRYWMLLNALKYGLSPMYSGATAEIKVRAPDETLADLWCKLPAKPGASYGENTDAEHTLPMPDLGNSAARNQELAQLAGLKTATGYIGDYVMRRATAVPTDPELPWLLYVTVQSTRGGCLDADAKTLSRSAFTLLHKRYKNNEWARKTPYFY